MRANRAERRQRQHGVAQPVRRPDEHAARRHFAGPLVVGSDLLEV
jgi:hypothetical protein